METCAVFFADHYNKQASVVICLSLELRVMDCGGEEHLFGD